MTEPDWSEPSRWCPTCGADASEVIELSEWGSAKPVAELRRYACCEPPPSAPTEEVLADLAVKPAAEPARRHIVSALLAASAACTVTAAVLWAFDAYTASITAGFASVLLAVAAGATK